MRKLNTKQRSSLEGGLATFLSMNLVGIVRAIVAWPLELWWGISFSNMIGFRIFSLILDIILAAPFWVAREGLYSLHFADRENRWHTFCLDTASFSTVKSTSYVFSLWLFTDLSKLTFDRLVWINIILLITTGAFNCWHIDVMRKQLPDITRRLIARWEAKRKTRRKRVRNN